MIKASTHVEGVINASTLVEGVASASFLVEGVVKTQNVQKHGQIL